MKDKLKMNRGFKFKDMEARKLPEALNKVKGWWQPGSDVQSEHKNKSVQAVVQDEGKMAPKTCVFFPQIRAEKRRFQAGWEMGSFLSEADFSGGREGKKQQLGNISLREGPRRP